MNYKEELLGALTEVCRKARKEGVEEGYSKGYEDCKQEYLKKESDKIIDNVLDYSEGHKDGYKQGLNTGWEAAKRIVGMSLTGIEYCGFGKIEDYNADSIYRILDNNDPQDIINKLREYDERVEVGDEIISDMGNKLVITAMGSYEDNWCCIDGSGCTSTLTKEKIENYHWRKTGKHFDIVTETLIQLKESEHEVKEKTE